MRIRSLFLTVLLTTAPAAQAAVCTSERVVGLLRDAIVKVETDNGVQVSGVIVAQDRVVTVWHGLKDAQQTTVHLAGQRYVAGLLNSDSDRDLALLRVPTGNVKPVTLLDRSLSTGESVWVYGWPADRFQTLGEGVFVGPWKDVLRVSSLVQAGQSGGALIACEQGREMLAGLVSGYGAAAIDGDLQRIPNMSFAVPASRLLAFFTQSDAVSVAQEAPAK